MADFSDARAKLGRANKHISEVQTEVAKFLATDFYRLRIEPYENDARIQVVFDSLHQPDKSLNLIVGDAISNLRSVLDYVVVGISGNRKGAFPFADAPNQFKGEVKHGAIGAFSIKLADVLLDEIQAYPGGKGQPLWTLNKLRNIDKHRLLLTTVHLAAIKLSLRTTSGVHMENCTFGVPAGGRMIIVDTPGHAEITSEPTPFFHVRLEEPPFVQSEPVVDLLQRLAGSVETCLKAFETFVP